jgi:hypothetical protein
MMDWTPVFVLVFVCCVVGFAAWLIGSDED